MKARCVSVPAPLPWSMRRLAPLLPKGWIVVYAGSRARSPRPMQRTWAGDGIAKDVPFLPLGNMAVLVIATPAYKA